jgi:hypothetical protein
VGRQPAAGQHHLPGLQRLPERVQDVSSELGRLVATHRANP